jgi:hypothetical protein
VAEKARWDKPFVLVIYYMASQEHFEPPIFSEFPRGSPRLHLSSPCVSKYFKVESIFSLPLPNTLSQSHQRLSEEKNNKVI